MAPRPSPLARLGRGVRTSLLDLLRRHSLFACLVGLIATYTGKLIWFSGVFDPGKNPAFARLSVWFFLAQDLVFFGGAMAALLLLDNLLARLLPARPALARLPGALLGLAIAVMALSNAFWLVRTGVQLNYSVVTVALVKADEVMPIAVAAAKLWGLLLLGVSLAAVIGLPLAFASRWRRDAPHRPHHRWLGLALPLLLVAAGVTCRLTLPEPWVVGWRLAAVNAIYDIVVNKPAAPTRPLPAAPPDPMAEGKQQPDRKRNVVIFIMEATSYQTSTFGAPDENRTPFLFWLGHQGLHARSLRAVLPHTTKSLVSILCGHYPAMQTATVETADNYGLRCLPRMLRRHGYRSAFFQTAQGAFEERPRLVQKMGFDHFVAHPHLAPDAPKLGYLASDDRTVVQPAARWAAAQEQPFLLVVLSSLTHHPYDLPEGVRAKGPRPKDRYNVLVRETDLVLQNLFKALRREGLSEDSIIMAMGDHGEAFGQHGLQHHDNVYFDEVLQVPLVIRAPGLISAGTAVTGSRSLLDVTPTLLDLLGLPHRPEVLPGHTLLRSAPPTRRYFACWYDDICVGYVAGPEKLVLLPLARTWVHFHLGIDPAERRPRVEPRDMADEAGELRRWLDAHRYDTDAVRYGETTLFDGTWRCADDGRCKPARVPGAQRGEE